MQAGMFNDESTHKERQQVLQSLMAKGIGDVGSGVHTPREINQLLARNDTEFRTFHQVHHSIPAIACTVTLCTCLIFHLPAFFIQKRNATILSIYNSCSGM